MSSQVRGVVRQGPQRERILVDVSGFVQQRQDKIAAANIVDQIAEEPVSERIIAQVLDQASAVGIAMGHAELVRRRAGILFQQKGLDLIFPEQVNDLFVGQNGIRHANSGGADHQYQYQ